MSLETNLRNLTTRIATEFRTVRTLITGSATGDLSGLSTTAKGNLVAAINEAAAAGGAQNLAQLTDVTITTPAAGHLLRHNGSGWVNVLGDTHYQPRNTDLDSIAALSTTAYGRALLTLADQAAFMGLVPAASETVQGKVELATTAEVTTGTDTTRAVTPAGLQAKINALPTDPAASETVAGRVELATAAETTTGTDTTRATHPAGVAAAITAAATPDASTTVKGKVQLATQTEVNTGTDALKAVTPATLQGRLGNYQPADSDLTAIAALSTTTYGRAFLALADQAALMALVRNASETVTGIVELATTAEATAGTDTTRAVTAAGLAAAIAGKANTSSLAAVALSGSAADLTGTLPTSVLPPLAINDVFVVVSQAAMLALTAQRGDMAIRTDNGRTYVLATDSPATLADWKEVTAAGAVTSVAGRTGAVTLAKADVGLSNVDNTSDANKPVSTAQQTALNGKQNLHANLTAFSGLTLAANTLPYANGAGTLAMTAFTAFGRSLVGAADAGAARTLLDVYSKGEIGNPEYDLVAEFNTALSA